MILVHDSEIYRHNGAFHVEENEKCCTDDMKKKHYFRRKSNCEDDNRQYEQDDNQSLTGSISTKDTAYSSFGRPGLSSPSSSFDTDYSSFGRPRSSSSSSNFTDRVIEEAREDASLEYQDDDFSSIFVTRPTEESSFWTEDMEDMLTLRRANPVSESDSLDFMSPNLYIEDNYIEATLACEIVNYRDM